jgi:hypothetical protein
MRLEHQKARKTTHPVDVSEAFQRAKLWDQCNEFLDASFYNFKPNV